MKDEDRTKEQLINELVGLRQRVAELEKAEAERKRAENKLREGEKRYRELADLLPQTVFELDEAGNFTFVNLNSIEIFGHTLKESDVGWPALQMFTPEERDRIKENFQRVLSGEELGGAEYTALKKDGSRFPVVVYASPIIEENKGAGLRGIVVDITERKQAEEELIKHREHLEELVKERTKKLQDAQEQLVRQEKLAVLGQLAGGVGHELRNPLGAIKNAAYFLNMVLEEPEPEVKETLGILEKEVATSERIISSLLGFARPKPPIRRKVAINEVIQEALYHVTVPENVKVVTQPDKSLPAILADPDQLGQAFSNITVNAIQAMPEGGQLAIKSKTSNQEWVTISFADTGVGVPKENLRKLFEPLFSTKAKGIGLGLAVTRTLVEGHGGTIKAQSEVGKGSTFTVRLPIDGEKEK